MFRLELWVRSADQTVADKLRVRLYDALTDGEASKPNSKARVPEFEVSFHEVYHHAPFHTHSHSHMTSYFISLSLLQTVQAPCARAVKATSCSIIPLVTVDCLVPIVKRLMKAVIVLRRKDVDHHQHAFVPR